jgi:cell division protein YceG involved in septum cleavage
VWTHAETTRDLFLLVMIAAIGGGWWMSQRLSTPYKGFDAEEVFVEIPRGTSVSGMAQRLADAGAVPDAFSFRIAARHVGRRSRASGR